MDEMRAAACSAGSGWLSAQAEGFALSVCFMPEVSETGADMVLCFRFLAKLAPVTR